MQKNLTVVDVEPNAEDEPDGVYVVVQDVEGIVYEGFLKAVTERLYLDEIDVGPVTLTSDIKSPHGFKATPALDYDSLRPSSGRRNREIDDGGLD